MASLIERFAQLGIRALSTFVPDKQEAPPSSPMPGRFYSGVRDDYLVDTTLRQLTPEKLGTAMRNADQGDTRQQMEVFERVEQDPWVTRLYFKRRLAIVGKTLRVNPANPEDGRAVQAADLVRDLIFGKDGWGGIENFPEALYDLTDAVGKAYALSQIVWEQDAGRWIPKRLEWWPQRECQLGDPLQLFAQDADQIRVFTDGNQVSGEPLLPHQWVVHIQKTWSAPLARAALFRSITWYYLFKKFTSKDWMIFAEKYGMPLRVGRHSLSATDGEKAALLAAVRDLGKDAACILPDGNTIELIESNRAVGGALPFPELVKHCDEQISVAISGSTMSITQGDRGARSAKEGYQAEEKEQTEYDCKGLAQTLRRYLATPIVGFNLGWDWPVPVLEFQIAEDEDLKVRAERDKILVDMGVDIPKRYFHEKYDVPEPEDGEEVVKKAAPPPSPFLPPGRTPEPEPPPLPNSGGPQGLTANILADAILLAAEKKSSQDWVRSMLSSAEESTPPSPSPRSSRTRSPASSTKRLPSKKRS